MHSEGSQGGVPGGAGATVASGKYAGVPYEEKERLYREITADERYHDYLNGCYECGVCVAACPSARFYEYSPRRITQAFSREDVELIYEFMNEDIWNCSQCYSCNRCRRGNSPGGLVLLMREVAVRNGLASAKEALAGYTRVVYKIHSTGTQVSSDMLQPEAFRDWGPYVDEVSANMGVWRKALPAETMRDATTTAWNVDEATLGELYAIWYLSGVMEMLKEVDEGVHAILEDMMEEVLEEKGYDLSEVDGKRQEGST